MDGEIVGRGEIKDGVLCNDRGGTPDQWREAWLGFRADYLPQRCHPHANMHCSRCDNTGWTKPPPFYRGPVVLVRREVECEECLDDKGWFSPTSVRGDGWPCVPCEGTGRVSTYTLEREEGA